MLHQMGWRKAPRDHRRLWVALTIALLLHAFFVTVVWYEMKPRGPLAQAVPAQAESAIQVRFITLGAGPSKTVPPPTVPPPPPPRPVREPLSKNAMTVHMPGPAPAPAATTQPPPTPAPVLFDRTGRIILPANASSAPSAPSADYVQRGPQGDTQIMHDQNPVKYKPTKLDPYWRNGGASSVDDALQKLVEKTTVTKTIQLPKGIRIHCGISLAALAGGCGGDPPPPPPSNDGDERLNMAPSSLVKGGAAPAKPDVATCIAIYKAGKPLPYGCPVDTPARAASTQKPSTGP
jgi:hypothetical protein